MMDFTVFFYNDFDFLVANCDMFFYSPYYAFNNRKCQNSVC